MQEPPSSNMWGAIDLGTFETFDAAVQAAGQWIKDHRICVLQIETVVLTGMTTTGSLSSQAAGLAVPPGSGAGSPALFWNQFARIWYDDERTS
jgi:hypothetical protein